MTLPVPDPTRPVKCLPDPYPTRGYGSGTGKPAGTGIPADPYYKALSTSTPTYIHALLTPYIPPRCLQSSSTGLLAEPRCRTVMGSRAFHASAPKEWNRLPLSLH